MTDESDSEDLKHIMVHKHPWRSQSKHNILLFRYMVVFVLQN